MFSKQPVVHLQKICFPEVMEADYYVNIHYGILMPPLLSLTGNIIFCFIIATIKCTTYINLWVTLNMFH